MLKEKGLQCREALYQRKHFQRISLGKKSKYKTDFEGEKGHAEEGTRNRLLIYMYPLSVQMP